MSSNTTRLTALDYARAWAIFGMIIVNYKLAMEVGDHGANWLQTIAGLFEGRASALFVVLAGVGVSLMTAKASISRNQHMIRENRKTLVKRAVFLFIAGTLLLLTGWSADILHYYAVFLLLASVLITVSDKTLLILAGLVLIVSSSMLILLDYSKGWDPGFHRYADFWTVEGFIRNLMFNGYHPLFPWSSFFLIGMWLGRKGWWGGKHRRKLMMYSLLGR
ncbi:heparan-alpha-glucosaminide N-acetyltransferase domain-containing protein [Paenibacillus sp. JZ16]|uniref:heparan-alpha-glucosaminide N-acetyltransferase domain-containing protein n=1 Tax=Paenibacillus sp. JZ16 TaxID=1906272 RepID=UPI001F4519B4|nr:heparan-alpha-glucosaminide N-acetyltransferase domain-containing protein [Paenibacillus sp. JZ16]